MIRAALIALLALIAPGTAARGASCENTEFDGTSYTICTIDMARDDMRLFLNTPKGQPYGYFGALDAALRPRGLRLDFAMNAGMYHEDRAPVGYYVEEGRVAKGVVSNAGPGNFGLLPNGILCLRDRRADVIETKRFQRQQPTCRFATQSGPMLVIDSALHPRFLPDSTSRYIRNGVGTTADGTQAVFAISNEVVTFHQFGRLFRDHLNLPNALYFDGNISRLRAPGLGRDGAGFTKLGPIIGVVEPVN